MKNIISLGAGVQSSTMALMAAHGEIGPMPDCAVFADTGSEPKAVYEWLDFLATKLPFPVVKVSVGSLSMVATTVHPSKNGGYLRPAIPVYFSGDDDGVGKRQCTMDFKITPVLRYANLIRGAERVSQWLGISSDEAHRMKPSRKYWCDNRYPLVMENPIQRGQCLEWMKKNGYPKPPRSACVFCPFHSDDEWLRLKTEEPDEFAKAVDFERQYQKAALSTSFKGIPFLHGDRKPLDEIEFVSGRNADLFGNECEGMCGV